MSTVHPKTVEIMKKKEKKVIKESNN